MTVSLTASAATVALAILGSVLWHNHTAQAQHAGALQRILDINAKTETRFVVLDASGKERHTLCNGGGWCITDNVPPDSTAPTPKLAVRGTGGFPMVDAAAIKVND